jgi:tetratricopeptide (TPR) repeat protein
MEGEILSTAEINLKDPGTNVAGRFRLQEKIGSGGMAHVYKAVQLSTGREVAIKFISEIGDVSGVSKIQVDRFKSECSSIAKMSHPNIVSVLDFGVDEGQPYIVMDYVDGSNLAGLIERSPLQFEYLLRIMKAVCDGLSHAHSKGIIHRDLKPSNIMIAKESSGQTIVKIVDFGIAKQSAPPEASQQGRPALTRSGELLGSPVYMSPEQCMGHSLDQRSDIYSLGCSMFEALTGKLPFSGTTNMEIIVQRMTVPPLTLTEAQPNVEFPDSVERIIKKTLEREPEKRYQSVLDLRADIEAVLQDQHILPSALPRKTKLWWLIGSTTALMVSGVVLMVGCAYFGVFRSRAPKVVAITQQKAAAITQQKVAEITQQKELISPQMQQLLKLEHSIPALEAHAKTAALIDVLTEAVALSDKLRIEGSPETAELLCKLGDVQRSLGNVDMAEAAYKDLAANLASSQLPKTDIQYERLEVREGIIALSRQQFTPAIAKFKGAVSKSKALQSPMLYIEARTWLADALGKSGKHVESAVTYNETAQMVRRSAFRDLDFAWSLFNAGDQYRRAGQYKKAIPLIKQSLQICKAEHKTALIEPIEKSLFAAEQHDPK